MSRRLYALTLLCLALALAVPARAEMAEALRREFHLEKDLGIRVLSDSTMSQLDAALRDRAVRILVLQVTPKGIDEDRAARVMDWVRSGHSVWFYDFRIAQYFGMRPFPMNLEQFRNKPEKGELGDEFYRGVATVAMATGPHEVLAGVGQASLFMPEFAPGVFGAVAPEGDTVPLLQFTPDSPCLAALRRDGRGLVVYKPLLWTLPLSGERFQLNLLEFSAGYPVPGPGGDGRYGNPPGPDAEFVTGNPAARPGEEPNRVVARPLPSPSPSPSPLPLPSPSPGEPAPSPSPGPVEASPSPSPAPPSPTPSPRAQSPYPDRVQVSTEGTLEGRVLNREFRLETTDETLLVPTEQIRSLRIRSPLELDRLEMKDGRAFSGFLLMDEIVVATPSGERTLTKRQVLRIDFPEAP